MLISCYFLKLGFKKKNFQIILTVVVIHDPERVRVQMTAELSNDRIGKFPDQLQVF